MAEYYDYEISFVDKTRNIVNEIIQKGFATLDDPEMTFPSIQNWNARIKLNLSKMQNMKDRERFLNYYGDSENVTLGCAAYFTDEGELSDCRIYYTNKWQPYLPTAMAISRMFPDDVLEIKNFAPYYDKNINCLLKNGEITDKSGEKALSVIVNLKPNIVKETSQGYHNIRLPLEKDGHTYWGSIHMPDKNCYKFGNDGYTVFFTEPEVTIYQYDTSKRITTEETVPLDTLISMYECAKETYHQKMQKQIEIPISDVTISKMHKNRTSDTPKLDYFIISIPCDENISHNHVARITLQYIEQIEGNENVSEYVNNGNNGLVTLGKYGKSRNAKVLDENSETITVRLTNGKLYESYKKEIARLRNIEQAAEAEIEADDIDL